jgi:hypothetical protein
MKAAARACALLLMTGMAGAARADGEIDGLIRNAAADRSHVPALMRQLVLQRVYVIGTLDRQRVTGLHVQDFIRNGRSFIPVFSDEAHFNAETQGSGFEARGVAIDANLFASILRGDELLVLNPGSPTPVDLDAKDFKALIDSDRLPKGGI